MTATALSQQCDNTHTHTRTDKHTLEVIRADSTISEKHTHCVAHPLSAGVSQTCQHSEPVFPVKTISCGFFFISILRNYSYCRIGKFDFFFFAVSQFRNDTNNMTDMSDLTLTALNLNFIRFTKLYFCMKMLVEVLEFLMHFCL